MNEIQKRFFEARAKYNKSMAGCYSPEESKKIKEEYESARNDLHGNLRGRKS